MIQLSHARTLKAAAEVRSNGFTYRAEVRHWGTGTGTDYARFNGGWEPLTWDALPRPAYRKLRAALLADAKKGPIE